MPKQYVYGNPCLHLPFLLSRTHGALLSKHSRLVLIWQNSDEGDMFCEDELVALKVQLCSLTGESLGQEERDPSVPLRLFSDCCCRYCCDAGGWLRPRQ